MYRKQKILQLQGRALNGVFVFGGALLSAALFAWSLNTATSEDAWTTFINLVKIGFEIISLCALIYVFLLMSVISYHQHCINETEVSRSNHPTAKSSRSGSL